MNGELHQICRLAAAARGALKTGAALSFASERYENRIEFQFLPEKKLKLFGAKAYKAENAAQWYDHCVKKGVRDIKLLIPTGAADAVALGFSNMAENSLACFYPKKVTYFAAWWDFDPESEEWNVLYRERVWKNAPPGIPRFENNSASFKDALQKIKGLALRIDDDSEFFADIFQRAFDILDGPSGCAPYTAAARSLPAAEMPEENLRLFEAACAADVFATSGSWTDSPPYLAALKGLGDEYDLLTDELLKQLRLAILYAINEW